jgi:hypothetical protein
VNTKESDKSQSGLRHSKRFWTHTITFDDASQQFQNKLNSKLKRDDKSSKNSLPSRDFSWLRIDHLNIYIFYIVVDAYKYFCNWVLRVSEWRGGQVAFTRLFHVRKSEANVHTYRDLAKREDPAATHKVYWFDFTRFFSFLTNPHTWWKINKPKRQ